MSTEGRLQGRVKWFNNKSGYGFISTLGEDSKDIFAHYSGSDICNEIILI